MNFKKTWNKKYGNTSIITKENSTLKKVEVDVLRLANGESKSYRKENTEFAILILGGKCNVSGEGINFENAGKRKNVFDGPATLIYIPANKEFKITATEEFSAVISMSPSEKASAPAIVNPEDVVIKNLGKPGWEREAHFILDERVDANMLYIGEAYVKGGQWSSYPPHKHDDDNMPTEAATEEIYYYEFIKEEGFGIQKVYTLNGDIDETYTVKSGEFVEMPVGYHPFHAAPGYDGYYLWIMAGKDRGFFMTTDPTHKWLNN